jgi:hypothetical protein
MESIQTLAQTLLTSIQAMGYITFAIVIIVDMILFRIHPILGVFATIATFAYLVHWI